MGCFRVEGWAWPGVGDLGISYGLSEPHPWTHSHVQESLVLFGFKAKAMS